MKPRFEMYERLMNDPKFDHNKASESDLEMVNGFVSYMSGLDITQFSQDLREFVDEHIKNGNKIEVPLKKPVHNYINADGESFTITNKNGLLKEIKDAFLPKKVTDGGWKADDLLVDYLKSLVKHKKEFHSELDEYIKEYNSKVTDDGVKMPKAPTSEEDVEKFVKDIFSDAPENTQNNHNTSSTRARKIREFVSQDKYLDFLGKEAGFYGEPLNKTEVHSKVAKFFSEGEPEAVDKFLERVQKVLKDLKKPVHFSDALVENLATRLKEMEDEYNMKHVKTYA